MRKVPSHQELMRALPPALPMSAERQDWAARAAALHRDPPAPCFEPYVRCALNSKDRGDHVTWYAWSPFANFKVDSRISRATVVSGRWVSDQDSGHGRPSRMPISRSCKKIGDSIGSISTIGEFPSTSSRSEQSRPFRTHSTATTPTLKPSAACAKVPPKPCWSSWPAKYFLNVGSTEPFRKSIPARRRGFQTLPGIEHLRPD